MTSISSGNAEMPAVGIGLWKIDRADTARSVRDAIQIGYRHIDNAADYANEAEAGDGIAAAIKDGLCRRDDLWVTSKLWNTYHHGEHVRPACERTLKDLKLDYLDLYLIHFPISLRYVDFDDRYPPDWFFDPESSNPTMQPDPVPLKETWQAMEELVTAGLVKQIGVCNFTSGLLIDLMSYSSIKPAMLQIESHPFLTQDNLIRFARDELGLGVTAFSPLGALSYVSLDMAGDDETVLSAEPVVAAAERVNRTAAQVVLRWGVQRGTAIIPKTTRPERLRENLALFDFELSDEEMTAISSLNRNRRFNDPGVFCEKAFGKFYPIYD